MTYGFFPRARDRLRRDVARARERSRIELADLARQLSDDKRSSTVHIAMECFNLSDLTGSSQLRALASACVDHVPMFFNVFLPLTTSSNLTN